jgi:uncharacterized protein YdaU (DUF1376 family)
MIMPLLSTSAISHIRSIGIYCQHATRSHTLLFGVTGAVMANKPPAFQFYVKDWLSSSTVRAMSLAARGAYIDLLAFAWQSQPFATLPNDPAQLRRLVGAESAEWADIWPQVQACFEVEDGHLLNRRLQVEARKREEFIQKQQANGAKGGRPNKNPGLSSGLSKTEAKESSSVCSIQSSIDTGTGTVQQDSTGGEQEADQNPTSTGTDKVLGDWADQLKLDETEQDKFAAVMNWKETISWWKGKPLLSLKAYREVERQYDKYYAKLPVGKKPHELLSSQATHIGGPRPPTLAEMVEGYSEFDKTCTCAEPKPDCNGNDAFAYGVSCVRCRGWLRLPNEVEHALTCTFLVNGSCSCGLDDLTEQLNDPKFEEWLESNAVPVYEGDPAPRSRAFEIED